MNRPKCGKEMVMRVSIDIVLPSRYSNLISKQVIRKKECKITSANWSKASATCFDCGVREVGL
jgi:hypothetical protein